MTMTFHTQFQKDSAVSPHGYLNRHIAKHAYKKGAYQGAAPADASRRNRSHYRVERRDGAIAVVFHHTDILTAYENGTVVLDSGTWHDAPTTREAMTHALALAGYRGWLTTKTLSGYRQTAFQMPPKAGGAWLSMRWHDGITITPDGAVSGAGPLLRYEADREARKAWREEAAPYKAMLPVLVAGLEARNGRYDGYPGAPQHDDTFEPEMWPALTAWLVRRCGYDVKACWTLLNRTATAHMNIVVEA